MLEILVQGFLLARPGPLTGPRHFPRPAPRRRNEHGNVLRRIVEAAATEVDLESLVRTLLVAVVELTELDTAYLTVLTDEDVLDHRYEAGTDLPGVPLAEQVGLRTFLSVPLTDDSGALVGTLCCWSTRAQFIPAEAVDQVRLCAQLIVSRLVGPGPGGPARLPRPSPGTRVSSRD